MNRRNVLTSIGTVGTAAIAGCTDQGEASTEKEEPDTDQEEPESKAPRIQRVELITGYDSFGDVSDNAIESTPAGSEVAIGIRYDYWHEDGEHAITAEAEIDDENGDQFRSLQDSAEQQTDDDGWDPWNWYLPFDTDGTLPGEFEATAQVTDDVSGRTSEPVSITFTIEEPESKAPRIQRVELVTEYNEYSDVADNAVESASYDEDLAVAMWYDVYIENGVLDTSEQIDVEAVDGDYDERLQNIAIGEDNNRVLTDEEGWNSWAWGQTFDLFGEPPAGEYEAEAFVRDDQLDETSEPMSTTFTIEE